MMNAKQYAELRGFPLVTLRRMLRERKIPCNQIGRVYWFDEKLMDEFLANQAEENCKRSQAVTPAQEVAKAPAQNKNLSWGEYLKANKAAILGL